MHETIERLERSLSESKMREGDAHSERSSALKRLEETEAQVSTLEVLNEGFRRDKSRVSTIFYTLDLE